MKKTLHKIKMMATLIVLFSVGKVFSQTNPTAQGLPYTQNFSTTTFTVMPTGMVVWTVNSSPIGSQTNAQNSTANGDASVTAATTTQTTGDAYGYATSSNGRLYLQTSSNTTNGTNQPVLAINTTGWNTTTVAYDIEMISSNPRTFGISLQYRLGTSGSWTNITGGVYSHNNSDRTNGQVDHFSVTLPSATDNQSVVQIRFAVWRGTQTGNSSGAALDNISISASSSQVGGYFRSKQNGNWNNLSTWEASGDSATWVAATTIPDYHANSILVKDSVSITATDSIDQTTVSTSGILTYANVAGSVVNIMNGTGVDLRVLGKYYDAGPSSVVWQNSSTKWELGANASMIRNRSTSNDFWRDHYNTIANIPASSNWIIIKNSGDSPTLSTVSNMHYGNLSILNTTGSLWTTGTTSSFTGTTDFPTIKGNLLIGGSGGVSFLNSCSNASPIKVIGNTTLESGSTLRNQGTGFELQGNVTINGTISTTGSAYILLSGNNTQTMSGSGLSFQYLTVNKSSVPATVTLSSPAIITGTLTLTNGLIVSTSTNLLTFNAGSASTGVNDSSFVSGPVKKIGNTDFIFPLGKNTNAQTIEISAPSNVTDAFQAEYFDTNPTSTYGVYTDTTFNYVSTCQYFYLQRTNGTSNIQPTLSYDATSCVSNLLPNPRVIGYDGTKWKDLGESNLVFSFSGGTISTATTITQYGAITLGNYNSLITNTPNGDTCFSAIIMPPATTSTLTTQSQSNTIKWYTFTPQSSEIKLTLTNTSMGSSRIQSLILMEGVCYGHRIVGIDSSYQDTTLTVTLHEVLNGIPYFINTVLCPTCTSTATFDLKVESLPAPTRAISNNVVSLNGIPSHMDKQILVRIDKSHLNLTNVDDTTMLSGTTTQFLDTTTINNIANVMYNGNVGLVNSLNMKKVYPFMRSSDTLALSRDSSIIRVPNFFETFVLTVTEKDKIFYGSRLLSTVLGYGEPNFVFFTTAVPNDNHYSADQASLHSTGSFPLANINVEGAWDIERGQSFVKVGLYDSGIDQTHDDLNSGKVAGGYQYYGNTLISSGTNDDGLGHGTSCAGIIGGFSNNSVGMAGIAGGDGSVSNPGCTLFDMKIFNASGSSVSVADECGAMTQGASSGAFGFHIMSNSWGGPPFSISMHDAVQFSVQSGVIFVASRGNYSGTPGTHVDDEAYPACFQDEMVINVGACGTDGKWKHSGNGNSSDAVDNNYSSMTKHGVDIIAPGTNAVVFTAQQGSNGYHGFNGTSAACPHVSGVSGLMLSHVDQHTPANNNLVIEDVEQILQMSANNLQSGAGNYDDNNGWGLMDATAAMNKIENSTFKIQHFAVGHNVSSSSVNKTLVNSNITLILPTNYNGLAAGTYYGDMYRADIFLNYTLSSPFTQIIGSWPRFSATLGWSGATPVLGTDNWSQIISVSSTQAHLRTFVYDFKYDQNGNAIDPVLPTANPFAGLSIYTKTPSVGIDELNSNNSLMSVYPNPTSNNSTVNISLTRSQRISLELYDTKGGLVKTVVKGKVAEGQNKYEVSLSDIAEGAYFYRLVTEDGVCEKKLVVIK